MAESHSVEECLETWSSENINLLLSLVSKGEIKNNKLISVAERIKKAMLIGRACGVDAGVSAIVGDTYNDQLDLLFLYGALCVSLAPHASQDIRNSIAKDKDISEQSRNYINSFCTKNNIGYVYLVKGTHDGRTMYKIGKANDLSVRLKKFEVIIPFDISLTFAIRVENPSRVEAMLHRQFAKQRVKGEWFDFNSDDVVMLVHLMGSIQSVSSLHRLINNARENECKLCDSDYIEYLESLLVFNGIDFNQSNRKV